MLKTWWTFFWSPLSYCISLNSCVFTFVCVLSQLKHTLEEDSDYSKRKLFLCIYREKLTILYVRLLKHLVSTITLALIYETNVGQKTGRTVISTQSSAFINMDVSRGNEQTSHQVSTRVHKFSSQRGLGVQHSKSGWVGELF